VAKRIEVELFADPTALLKAFRRASRGTSQFNKDVSKLTRGALAGSGAFRGFGRSIAFASGGFIAAHTASEFLTDSINAAREAAVAQRSLAAQMKTSNESFKEHRDIVEQVALSYGKFGFQNDEVIQSLTVLERATGKINAAIALQGGVADLARAKNIDLASAAAVVAKVFGGQETALRRAVPGLAKNAHGLDLIRAAFAKLHGQAAANTTASERFAATLHDTQEIIGTALLPTLNKYLDRLTKYLQRLDRSGELQRRVTSTVERLTAAFSTISRVISGVTGALGGFRNAITVAIGAWAGFKLAGIASAAAVQAANLAAAGVVSSAWKAALISTGWGALAVAAGIAAAEIITHWQKVKDFFHDFYLWLQEEADKAALGVVEPFSHLPSFLGGWARGAKDAILQDMQTLEEQAGQTGAAVQNAFTPPGLAGPTGDLSGSLAGLGGTGTKKRGNRAQLRNQWFDAMIGRQLDRVQDLALKGQLARLKQIAEEVRKRLGVTKDVTRRLTLQDQLVAILRQERSVQADITSQIKEQNQALKDRADAIKSAILDRLQAQQTRRENQRALKDAEEQLRLARAIGGRHGIQEALRNVQDVRFQILQAQLEAAQPRLRRLPGGGQALAFGGVTININGVTDPDKVAQKVVEVLRRRQRRTSQQQRGAGQTATGAAR
jgi:23S rRNA pseudoU1915 N3-methylase RlmH